ncbi:hypothetical protein Ciccas_012315 [Cichlidogyrus casuarinus]|uniref:EF-hand domain-containing protein n=1 Tax=Cichlidogyrus casuarinus TaxID=1844966 RepID=A0ABD2PNQ6_9PLAT
MSKLILVFKEIDKQGRDVIDERDLDLFVQQNRNICMPSFKHNFRRIFDRDGTNQISLQSFCHSLGLYCPSSLCVRKSTKEMNLSKSFEWTIEKGQWRKTTESQEQLLPGGYIEDVDIKQLLVQDKCKSAYKKKKSKRINSLHYDKFFPQCPKTLGKCLHCPYCNCQLDKTASQSVQSLFRATDTTVHQVWDTK